MKDEDIACIYAAEIRTMWDNYSYLAFITNHRTILADLKVSSAYLGFGTIGMLAMMKKTREQIRKLKERGKDSLDEILKSHKKNIEIRYDKVNKIEYKHGKKWEVPVLTIHYAEPLRKKKYLINVAILPDQDYIKAKKEKGIKGGHINKEFGNDLLNVIQPYVGDKLVVIKK